MTEFKGKRSKADILCGVRDTILRSRKLKNNTVAYTVTTASGKTEQRIRLHDTDIIIITEYGHTRLESGGWRTYVTKDRINEFAPVSMWQDRGLWYVSGMDSEKHIFFDGITFNEKGICVNPDVEDDEALRVKETTRLINRYTNEMRKLDTLPVPYNGDCFWCHAVCNNASYALNLNALTGTKEKIEPSPFDLHCLLSHLNDEDTQAPYIHGSLIINAMRSHGYQETGIAIYYDGWNKGNDRWHKDVVCRAVRAYFKKHLAIAR